MSTPPWAAPPPSPAAPGPRSPYQAPPAPPRPVRSAPTLRLPQRPPSHPLVVLTVSGIVLPPLLLPGIDGGLRLGLGVPLAAVLVAAPVLLARRRHGPLTWVLAAIALALCAVSAVRASTWLAGLCALAGTLVAVLATARSGSWPALLTSPFRLLAGSAYGPRWLLRRLPRGGDVSSVLLGLVIGGGAVLVVGVLLASGDVAFADAVRELMPSPDWVRPERLGYTVYCAVLVLGGVTAQVGRWARPGPAQSPQPRTGQPRTEQDRSVASDAVVWTIPLALVAAVIAVFLAVQAAVLFGGAEVVLQHSGVTYAGRARQGFGQLSAVTAIVLGLLTWAAHCAADTPAHRHRLMLLGGLLTGMSLLLAVSALRRLWFYEQAAGWTVTRIVAGSAEIWLVTVILAVPVVWWFRAGARLPRLLVAWAGIALLAVALASPDALVASWNVHRFAATGQIDLDYLSMLSADAVPALQNLPTRQRDCVLGRWRVVHSEEQPGLPGRGWTDLNLGRVLAAESLKRHPVPELDMDTDSDCDWQSD
jgi:hypothetical protein